MAHLRGIALVHPLEPRTLLAAAVTYTLIELPLNVVDLNNADQLLGTDAIYQIHRGGRLTKIPLPTLNPDARLAARKFNDDGIVIATEGFRAGEESVSQPVVLGPNRHGVYVSRYLFDDADPTVDQPDVPVAINNAGQILTNGGESETIADRVGDVRLFRLGRRGSLTSVNANGLLPGGTRTIDDPIDLNNRAQFVTTDGHYPIDNFVALRRGVASLQTAEQLAGGVPAPVQKLNALNDAAQIVGATQQPGADQHLTATLYQTSRRGRYYRTFLGTLPGDDTSESVAINNAGQILGFSYSTPAFGAIRDFTATITQPNERGVYGRMQDLNTLISNPGKDVVTRPIAINDAGLILAEGASTRNGTQRFLLLIPSRSNRVTRTAPRAPTVSNAPTPTMPALSRPSPFATTPILRSDPSLW